MYQVYILVLRIAASEVQLLALKMGEKISIQATKLSRGPFYVEAQYGLSENRHPEGRFPTMVRELLDSDCGEVRGISLGSLGQPTPILLSHHQWQGPGKRSPKDPHEAG